jgi:uncharacterized membrane protein
MSPHRFRVPLGILFLAFGLRLVALNVRPLWFDDAFSIFLAEENLATMAFGTAADTMPPLYYALLHFWIPLVGETPFAMRTLSVAISLSILALVYVIASRAFNPRAGNWAMFFAALAPFQIYHAQELRMYGALALGSMLYLYGVMRLSSGKNAMLLVAIGMAVALYSHNLAFLTLAAANVYFLFRRAWRAQMKLIAAQVIGALLFVPWLLYVPGQIAKIQRAFWTQPPGLVDLAQMLLVFTTYLPLPTIALVIVLFLTLVIFAIAALELARWLGRGAPASLGLLLTFALAPPALMFALSYLMRPIFVPRGIIVSSLVYYILLAMLAARAPRVGRAAIAVVACGIALMTLPFLYSSWGEWRRAPFVEADQFLRAQMRQGDLILHDNKLSFFPMRFYDRALPQQFLADPPGSSNDTFARGSQEAMKLFPVELDEAIEGRARVWFVIFQTAIDEAAQEGRAHGNLAPLDAARRRTQSAAFGDLRILLYESR